MSHMARESVIVFSVLRLLAIYSLYIYIYIYIYMCVCVCVVNTFYFV